MTKAKEKPNSMVKYEEDGKEVSFTAEEVRNYLCPNATDSELALLMALCQQQHLNPLTKDVYLVKYGNSPASIITSKEVFTKRAQANPKFDGMEAGLTFITPDGQIVQRQGSMTVQGWNLIGGWCKVYVKDYRVPIYDEVSMAEYSTGKGNWSKMPGTMIRKVALCHALREAFPDDFQGLYGAEEMGKVGDMAETQTTALESASEPQSDIQAVPIVADFVEVASDDQLDELRVTLEEIMELRCVDDATAYGWIHNSKTIAEAGATPETSFEEYTPSQCDAAIALAHQLLDKAREMALEDEDITF